MPMSPTRFLVLILTFAFLQGGLAGADDTDPTRHDAKGNGDKAQLAKVSTPVSGIILVLGTEINKGDQVPADRIVTIGGVKYRRLMVGDRVHEGEMLIRLDNRLAEADVIAKNT